MSKFVIYDKTTGQIRQVSTVENIRSISHLLTNDVDCLETESEISDNKFYVDTENKTFQEIPQQPDEFHVWDWGTHNWESTKTLEIEKEIKWKEIKQKRSAAIEKPFATDYGTFDAGLYARMCLKNAEQHLENLSQSDPQATTTFTLEDNSEVELNKTQISEIVSGLIARTEECYSIARNLRKQIALANTTSDLNAINWPDQ